MSKLPIFELCISVGNIKPKLEWFFKLKLKPKLFYWTATLRVELPEKVEELVDPVDDVEPEPLPQELGQHDGVDEGGVGGAELADQPLHLFQSLQLRLVLEVVPEVWLPFFLCSI